MDFEFDMQHQDRDAFEESEICVDDDNECTVLLQDLAIKGLSGELRGLSGELSLEDYANLDKGFTMRRTNG